MMLKFLWHKAHIIYVCLLSYITLGVASTYTNLLSQDRIEWIHENMCVTDDANVVVKNGRNAPCVLPFTYNRVHYTACTSVDSDWPWCSLLTDSHGEHIDFANTSTGVVVKTWGYCDYKACQCKYL